MVSHLFEIRQSTAEPENSFHVELLEASVIYVRWYKVPNSIASIPRVATLQSLYIDRHPLSMPNGPTAGLPFHATNTVTATIPYIKLSSPPSAIIIAIKPDLQHITFADNSTHLSCITANVANSEMVLGSRNPAWTKNQLCNGEIVSLQLTVNTDGSSADFRDSSETFNQFRLFKLLQENALDDFCLYFDTWRKKRCFVCLRPNQVAAFTASPGTAYTVTLERSIKFRNASSGGMQYKGNIILLYGTHMCTLTSDSCAFSFQRVPLAIAENQIRGYTLPSANIGASVGSMPQGGNMLSHNY